MMHVSCPIPVRPGRRPGGFSLIELLLVIAVLSALLAILLPALDRARASARRVKCGANLKSIGTAWLTYLGAENDCFYQAPWAQLYYGGGWEGAVAPLMRLRNARPWPRPLNRYVAISDSTAGAGPLASVFQCPADSGGAEGYGTAEIYRLFGNSYAANIYLIGDIQIPTHTSNSIRAELHGEINKRLMHMTAAMVTNPPQEVILAGDYGWQNQALDLGSDTAREQAEWHRKADCYNVVFVDGHVSFQEIALDRYFRQGQYYVLPFQELNKLAEEVHRDSEP